MILDIQDEVESMSLPSEPRGREREGIDDPRPKAPGLGPLGDRHRRRPVSAARRALKDENLVSRHGKPLSRSGL